MKRDCRTIVLSDLHLGTSGSKAKEVTEFLKQHSCDTLILNGDVIDGWQLKKFGKWKRKHTRFFKQVLKMVEKKKTDVVYLRGNHDDFLDQVIPIRLGSISVVRDYYHHSANGKTYYITHGDIFDSVTSKLRWLAKLGDVGYTLLLFINKIYNNYREKRGKPYYSLSQKIKGKFKQAVNYISNFETELAELARIKECQGIICGHIHMPADRHINGIHYLNSGDWVESLTALIETRQGEWEVYHFHEEQPKQGKPVELASTEDDEEAEDPVELWETHKVAYI